MMATLEMVRAKYGSIEKYMTEQCGLSPEQVARIRANLIAEVDLDAGPAPVEWETHDRAVAQVR